MTSQLTVQEQTQKVKFWFSKKDLVGRGTRFK